LHQSPWLAFGNICRGFALAGLGRPTEEIAQLRRGLSDMHRVGAHLLDTQWLGFLAEAHLQAPELDEARAALDRAIETAAATGECYYQAELYRLRGVVVAKSGEAAEAGV
jgi:predicted ATPase